VHESQSLLWERMVALSRPFATYLAPKIKNHFPSFPDNGPEALYAAQNVLRAESMIRVESDEARAAVFGWLEGRRVREGATHPGLTAGRRPPPRALSLQTLPTSRARAQVTYPLHIILRFEIEKGLLDGSIQARAAVLCTVGAVYWALCGALRGRCIGRCSAAALRRCGAAAAHAANS